MSLLPPPAPSAYHREKKPEHLVHVGYNITLTEQVLQEIRNLFPEGLAPETLHAGPHNTAVLHISQGNKQEELHRWFKKADKNVDDEARVRSIYHRLHVTFDNKDGKPKSCRGIVALYITVGGNHLYLNVYNDTGIPPFRVKKEINATPDFPEKKFATPLEVTAVAYKHE